MGLGDIDDTTKLLVDDRNCVDGPIVRPGHKHWAAVVTPNSRSSLGCNRKFWRRAAWCRYHVPPKLKSGDVVEFRVADSIAVGDSEGHNERQFRFIGIVVAILESTILLAEEMSIESAFETIGVKKKKKKTPGITPGI